MPKWAPKLCRRRPKTIILVTLCLGLTVLLGFQTRIQSLNIEVVTRNRNFSKNAAAAKQEERIGPPYLLGDVEDVDTPVESKHAIYQSNEDEVKAANYFTNDIFKEMQIGGQPKRSRAVPPSSKKKLEVFVLPFTHVDPGWLKTFDAYSEDTNTILNNMYSFMSNPKNKAMRFLWAEFVFFERWWNLQNDTVKDGVRKFVNEGRLELASGSWVMTDEANAYYPVSVDNIIEGHQFLQSEFKKLPTTIWSNDPFGYSHSVPYLFARAGIKRAVINRIHHPMKHWLQSQKAIPFHWRQYFDKEGTNDVLTHVLPYTHYDIPNSCGPDSSICCQFDFRRMTDWGCGGVNPVPITSDNVKQKAATFVNQLKKMSEMYESNVLLVVHGDDFRFDKATEWNQQHDNFIPLFEEINKGDAVSIRFGTFNDYFTALEKFYKDNKKTPAKLSGDFFPYQCAMGTYWTGYFTTRPFYKRQGRNLHAAIHAADSLLAIKKLLLSSAKMQELVSKLTAARRVLLLFQHHDAITGTSKKSVMKDYSELLHKALLSTYDVISELQNNFEIIQKPINFDEIPSNAVLKVLEGKPISLSIYNQLPYKRPEVITIRTSSHDLIVAKGKTQISAQFEPYLVKGKVDSENLLLSFPIMLGPLTETIITLYTSKDAAAHGVNVKEQSQKASIGIFSKSYENVKNSLPEFFAAKISKIQEKELVLDLPRIKTRHDEHGNLKAVQSLTAAVDWISLTQKFVAYTTSRGGAYIMSAGAAPAQPHVINTDSIIVVKGTVRHVMHVLNEHDVVRHTYSINNLEGSPGERIHWKALVDITQRRNFELATRFDIAMNINKTVDYTDSVGLQLIRRSPAVGKEVGSEHYPMPTTLVIDDKALRLSIFSNVEHGAMFPTNASAEIMLDRMLNQDDGKGLGSAPDGIPDDLKLTEMDFTILLEQSFERKINDHHGYNSLGGHLSLLTIIYPPITLAAVSFKQTFNAGISNFILPCEYQLISMRYLSYPEENKLLIVIHRVGIDVGPSSMVHCITSGLKESIQSFLTKIKAIKVQRTNLGGVTVIGTETGIDNVNLDAAVMDFIVLKVSF